MATKIMKGNTYPQKVTSEDGTRTVEVHAGFHRQPNRLVMKDNDKKYLLESGAIEANRIFDLEKKQISFVIKAKLSDAPYVINKVNANRTIEIEKFKKSYIKEKLQNKAI